MTWTAFQERHKHQGREIGELETGENKMSQQSGKKITFQVRVDRGLWKVLSQLKTDYGWSFKELTEHALIEMYTGMSDEELNKLFNKSKNG